MSPPIIARSLSSSYGTLDQREQLDAALDGVQRFPPEMNFSNEIHRFGRAGELYAQADPAKLAKVTDQMVELHLHIASVYSTRSSYNNALSEANKALALEPDNPSALPARAR